MVRDRRNAMKTREQIYIVPCWAGIVFAAVVLSLFVIVYIAHGFGGLPQILVISLVVAGIVALIQTNENLRGIVLYSCHSRPVAAGEDAILEVTLANESDRERIGLRVRIRQGWSLKGEGRIPVLKAGGREVVRITIPTTCRGRFPNPSFWVSSTLPAGLCFSWKVLADRGAYYVYPKPAGQPLAAAFPQEGQSGAGARKGNDDVGGHRPYVAGDLLSRMDWKIFAKSGKLVIRTFVEGDGERVLLRWEDTAPLGHAERRLEQLSFWVSECACAMQPFEMQLDSSPGLLTDKNLPACRIALASFRSPL